MKAHCCHGDCRDASMGISCFHGASMVLPGVSNRLSSNYHEIPSVVPIGKLNMVHRGISSAYASRFSRFLLFSRRCASCSTCYSLSMIGVNRLGPVFPVPRPAGGCRASGSDGLPGRPGAMRISPRQFSPTGRPRCRCRDARWDFSSAGVIAKQKSRALLQYVEQ